MNGGENNLAYIKKIWNNLVGEPEVFSMEHRVFHLVNLITFILLSITLGLNFIVRVPGVNLMISIVLVIVMLVFYIARYKNYFRAGVATYIVVSYITLLVNFYLNSGIDGPSLCACFFVFQCMMAITAKKWHPAGILFHIVFVVGLISLNYYYPEIILHSYPDEKSRLIDFGTTYIIALLFIYSIIVFLINNYHRERILAEERARSIEEQNGQIMLQKEELEKLNDEKNKLFSIVSHDVRSPLSSIQGYLEILSIHELGQSEKAEIEKDLLSLTKNTSDMIQNLLSWSHAQMQGVNINLGTVNLKELIGKVLSVQKTMAEHKNIRINQVLDENIYVYADYDMLQLVIRNLVNNAIKFSPTGKTIDIRATAGAEEALISIRDQGIGISPEKQKDIFSLKAQSTAGTKSEKGTGLGLVLCKEFIELQQGKIGFETEYGKGTEFYVTLPVSKSIPSLVKT